MSSATLMTPPTTPLTTPPTTVPTKTYLIRITRYNALKSAGSRIMSVPGETHFKVFHAAVATAIGWNSERCTFWSFKNTKKSPLVASHLPRELGCSYGIVVPSELDDHGKLNEWMSLETRCRFWLYDGHFSRQQHTITVMSVVADDRPRIISLWGGQGIIDKRQAWGYEDINCYSVIKAIQNHWEMNTASTPRSTGSVEAENQQRAANGAVFHKAETYIKEEEDDEDKDAVVRRDRGTKRRLPDSFRSNYSHKRLRR